MLNYIFYDFETTGLSHGYDQVLQFAAITTDENMCELPEATIDIRCRLLPHIVPSPTALSITNVSPDLLLNQDLSNREFMHTIEEWSKQWGTAVFLGYNSIKFDENMMRHSLYQTLHAPYLTNTNGNMRADVMRLAHAAFLFDPEALKIPLSSKGRPIFKLGVLAAENGIVFDDDEAHDALYDVRKTIELAELIKNKVPDVWNTMLFNSTKNNAIDFIDEQDVFAAGDVFYNKPYRWIMTGCGTNSNNPAEKAAFDLSYSPDEYMDLSIEELVDVLNQRSKVIRPIRTNAQPFISNANKVSKEYWDNANVIKEEAIERAQIIKSDLEFQSRVGQALANRYEGDGEESPHIEDKIYEGFPSNSDSALMEKFHQSTPEKRLQMLNQFEDARYKQIARRLVYFETPEVLPDDLKTKMSSWVNERLNAEDEVPWRTLSEAIAELEELKQEKVENDPLLQEIESFLNDLKQE